MCIEKILEPVIMSGIKKFNLTYQQVPKIFSLPESVFLSKDVELIPEEVLKQTKTQKNIVAKTIEQIDKDLERTCYVDFDGLTVAQLKSDWLTVNPQGDLALSEGVYPSFSQGDNTGAVIGEILQTKHFSLPLSEEDPKAFMEVTRNTTRICFSYKNSAGQPSGFSLVAAPNGDSEGNHKGWIISVIQNTVGNYKGRKVSVLASPNYVRSEAQSTVDMDTPDAIERELKRVINNDKVASLIKGIFKEDGTLNADYIRQLASRIKGNRNIDDRDRKSAQFNILIELAEQLDDEKLRHYINSIKADMAADIEFFKDGIYEQHLSELSNKISLSLSKMPSVNKKTTEIGRILNNISERYAQIKMIEDAQRKNPELSHIFKAMAQKIKSDFHDIKFDGTHHDNRNILLLSQFEVASVEQKIRNYYQTNPLVKQYFVDKDKANHHLQVELSRLSPPKNEGFFSRNKDSFGFSIFMGLIVGVSAALFLTGVLAPIGVALIAVGAALITTGLVGSIDIHVNEKEYANETSHYSHEVKCLRSAHREHLVRLEKNLHEQINLSDFLTPDKPEFLSGIKVNKKKPLTPERVAHALWLQDKSARDTSVAKNRFSIWAAKQENLDFGIEEVESVIKQRYVMKS
ncbi:TPA: Dot/Icm T4SS effector RavS [Legionella pneumophila]|nr:Dot/Icm T4SS effector RavS [Legionella pneumophila]